MPSSHNQVLLLNQEGSPLAEMLLRSLRAAGIGAIVVDNVYDVVIEAERADGGFDAIVLGVDHFGSDELRLVPLARRRWPDTIIAAYHSDGFGYKGRLAEMVGADRVLSGLDGISDLLEELLPTGGSTAVTVAPDPFDEVEEPEPDRQSVPAPPPEPDTNSETADESAPRAESPAEAEEAEDSGPAEATSESPGPDVAAKGIVAQPGEGLPAETPTEPQRSTPSEDPDPSDTPDADEPVQIELTEEELKLLLAEDDE